MDKKQLGKILLKSIKQFFIVSVGVLIGGALTIYYQGELEWISLTVFVVSIVLGVLLATYCPKKTWANDIFYSVVSIGLNAQLLGFATTYILLNFDLEIAGFDSSLADYLENSDMFGSPDLWKPLFIVFCYLLMVVSYECIEERASNKMNDNNIASD